MVPQDCQGAKRRRGCVVAKHRGGLGDEARRFGNEVAAKEQQIWDGREEKGECPIDITCSNRWADVRIGHKANAERLVFRARKGSIEPDLLENWLVWPDVPGAVGEYAKSGGHARGGQSDTRAAAPLAFAARSDSCG